MTPTATRLLKTALLLAVAAATSSGLVQAQLSQAVGTWSVQGSLADPRTGAASVVLDDGRTLVLGGRLADGTITDSVVSYDPVTNGVTSVGQLFAPRVNLAAARLEDGRVVVSGGHVGGAPSGDVEIFDPVAGTSTFAATMAVPRAWHAAAQLADDRVLIVGGATTDGSALATAEIFDLETSSVASAGAMATARLGLSATTLIDKHVLIVGGSTGSENLASAELFDPIGGTFVDVPTQMAVARAGHTAVLLPHNGSVLVAGGTVAGASVTTVDLFVPPIFPDPYSYGIGSFAAGNPTSEARAFGFGGPVGDNGLAYAAGGGGPHAEWYRFATVRTDKDDYIPGQTVIMTGDGWVPGETVTLLLQENPQVHEDRVFTAVADATGHIANAEFVTEDHHFGVEFFLTASGSASRAQTRFMDARMFQAIISPTAAQTGVAKTYTLTVFNFSTAGESFDCVVINIPTGAGTPSALSVVATDPGPTARTWSTPTVGGGLITTTRNGGAANSIDPNGSISVTFTATATTTGIKTWSVAAYANQGCNNSPATIQPGFNQPTVNIDNTPPTVTINQASGQADPTNTSPINFTVTFSEEVGGFGTAGDVTLSGTAGATTAVVTSTGTTTYNVAVSGMTGSGTVIASVAAGAANDIAGNPSAASTSTDNTVTYDATVPTVVSINRNSASPTNLSSVSWTVEFSENVTGVNSADFALAVSGLNGTPAITGVTPVDANTYTVAASTGGGTGSLGLNLVDDDSIVDNVGNRLGGTGASNGNFTGQVYDLDRTLTPTVTVANKVYDGTTAATIQTRGYTSTLPVPMGVDVSVTGGTATFSDKHVANGKTVTVTGLSLTGADSAQFILSSTSANTTADITPRTLTVTATGANKVYDGTTAATVTLADDRIAGDVLTITYTASFADKHVGTGKPITVTGITITGGADQGNYALANTTANATADITPRPLTVTATGVNKVYDGTTAATVTLADDALAGDIVTVGYTTASFANKNVGTGKTITVTGITITGGADQGNYAIAGDGTATASADITPRTITATATGINKVYDGTTTATVTLAHNALSGDVVTLAYASASFANKNVGTGKTISVTGISISPGGDGGNYTLASTTAPASANITALHVTGSFTAGNKEYDGNTTASVTDRFLVAVIAGDDLDLDGGTATFDTRDAGTGKTVTLVGASLIGGDKDNYVLDGVSTTTANITQKHVTGSFTAADKTYDGTTDATVLTRDPGAIISGDSVTLNGGTATFNNRNVGNNKTVTLAGATLGGTHAGNYYLDGVSNALADIAPLGLTITAVTDTKVYDGTTSSDETPTVGPLGYGDTVAGLAQTYDNKNAGTGKTLSVSAYTVNDGNGGNNYLVTPVPNHTGVITQKALTVTGITANNKPFDGYTTATLNFTGATLNGVITGDIVSLVTAGAVGTFSSAAVGTHTVTITGLALGGGDAGNYYIYPAPTTTASITAWTLSGFLQPVGIQNTFPGAPAAPPNYMWNTIKGGQTVPLKFELFATAGGTELTSLSDVSGFALAALPCMAGGEDPVDPEFVTPGATVLRYTDGHFIQNWDSPKGGGKCYRVTMTARDGSQLSAFFKAK